MASLIASSSSSSSTHLPPKPLIHLPSPSSPLPFSLSLTRQTTTLHLRLCSARWGGKTEDFLVKKREEDEDDDDGVGLERKIVEFMKGTKKPDKFPTRKELVEAGRMDLVEGIVKRGGWMTLGWDVVEETEGMEFVDWRAELERLRLRGEMGIGDVRVWIGKVDEEEGCSVRVGSMSPDDYLHDRSLWETKEGDTVMVREIIEFMKSSKRPNRFPHKKELIEAGRKDLADAIVKRGGWMTLGWDEDYAKGASDEVVVMQPEHAHFIEERSGPLERVGVSSSSSNGSLSAEVVEGSFTASDSSAVASSSGRSLEVAEEHTGIEGILNRLEKQRNSTFGLNLVKNKNDSLENGHFGGLSRYADTWRTWSIQRAGSDGEFEAGEIDFGESRKRRLDSSKEKLETTKDANEPIEDLDSCTQIRTRLQHLEAELSSALSLLRSSSDELPQKGRELSSNELNKLPDAWEFQENEIMRAKDKLRSIRANVAVLEGKMALAINDAQRVVDDKQRRINDARMALQLLRTTYVVWPNSASEVLLSGSFDGWTTQRKMERSITGVFSLTLKLYPGKYEIKFIVDGVWKVDPLRPVAHCNGYENNLLIVE